MGKMEVDVGVGVQSKVPLKQLDNLEQLQRVPPLGQYSFRDFVDQDNALEVFVGYLRNQPDRNVDEKAAADSIFDNFDSIFDNFLKPPLKSRMAAVAAAPGKGKSRFLNVAAQSAVALGYFPIAATFNVFSPIVVPENLFWALSKRVLFS